MDSEEFGAETPITERGVINKDRLSNGLRVCRETTLPPGQFLRATRSGYLVADGQSEQCQVNLLLLVVIGLRSRWSA